MGNYEIGEDVVVVIDGGFCLCEVKEVKENSVKVRFPYASEVEVIFKDDVFSIEQFRLQYKTIEEIIKTRKGD